jgi:IS5 family transposase
VHLDAKTKCPADTGYQGLSKRHSNSELPKKRARKSPLSRLEKRENRSVSSRRILIENIIREVKIFRIIAEK